MLASVWLCGVQTLVACWSLALPAPDDDFQPDVRPLPADPAAEDGYEPLAGYAAMAIPADNPLTPEKAALGRLLYHDSRLSGDGSRSCYSCHTCENGLSDGRMVAVGAYEKVLTRNSPTLWNIGFHSEYYWDGRSPSLEKQALAAWTGGNMGAKDPQPIVDALNAIPGYRAQFESVFGGPATVDNVPMALAAHMRTIIGGKTPWDRHLAGEEDAVSEAAVRGYSVFQQARCVLCHVGVLFTDQQFHNVGAGQHHDVPDVGRFKVTEQKQHTGAFKTPTLRDVAQSGPYFHDGSIDSLEEAVRFMLAGGGPNEFLDPALRPVELSDEQFADLIAFLESLDEECDPSEPVLP